MLSTTTLSTRLHHVGTRSNWPAKALLSCKALPCSNRIKVTAFPAEHMVTIVHFGLRPNASKHHIRVCACLAAQFVFFSRSDSGVLLTAINAQVSDSTLSINQAAKNVDRNQAAPSSRVS